MRKMKPANDITEIKRPSPKPSLTPTSAVTWNSIPYHIKQQDSLEKFCGLIKKWKPDCKCKSCKDCIGHVGYIQITEIVPIHLAFFFVAAIIYLFLTNFEHF